MTLKEFSSLIKLKDNDFNSYNNFIEKYTNEINNNLKSNENIKINNIKINEKEEDIENEKIKNFINSTKLLSLPENISKINTYTSIENRLHYVPGSDLNLSAAWKDFTKFIEELGKNTIKDLEDVVKDTKDNIKSFGKDTVTSFIPRLHKKIKNDNENITRSEGLVTFDETIFYAKNWFDREYKIEEKDVLSKSQNENIKSKYISENEGDRKKWYFGKIRELVEIKNPSQMFQLMSIMHPSLGKHQYNLYLEKDVLNEDENKDFGIAGFRVTGFPIPKFSKKTQNLKYGYTNISLLPDLFTEVENLATIEIIVDRNLKILKRLYDITGIGMNYNDYYDLSTISDSNLFPENLTAFLVILAGKEVNYASNIEEYPDNKNIIYSKLPIFIFDNFKIINVDSSFKFSTKSQDSYKIKITATWTSLRMANYENLVTDSLTSTKLQSLVKLT